jgi:flagellar L-ring protein precursor FlgH
MKLHLFFITALLCAGACAAGEAKKEQPSPLDKYVVEAMQRAGGASAATAGSLYSPASLLVDLAADIRARRVDDLVTVVVLDKASAISRGTVNSSRAANARASIDVLANQHVGWLSNMASLGGQSELTGEGETSRETVLSTSITTRVAAVLPNGYLVIDGTKQVRVNSENQVVTVRGVVRPIDLSPGNAVLSDQIAQLEIAIDGKGVVGDAIRRPNFLYRMLLGILPF